MTKHDREMSERSNGRRMMEFPPGIHTGDGAALNGPQIQVSNSVYNKIRQDFSPMSVEVKLASNFDFLNIFFLIKFTF